MGIVDKLQGNERGWVSKSPFQASEEAEKEVRENVKVAEPRIQISPKALPNGKVGELL